MEKFKNKLKEKPVKKRLKEAVKNIVASLKRHKKISISIAVSLCTLLVIYFGMTIYFINHFYFGTEINSINVSGKSVEKVNAIMEEELRSYNINLKERGGKSEQIKAEEVGLKYNSEGDFRKFKDSQHPIKWVSALFNKEANKLIEETFYDKEMLKERVDKLACFDSNNIVEPKNAGFKYDNNKYIIVDEVLGNKVDKDILYKHVAKAIEDKEEEVDLEVIDCYVKPEYTSKSPQIIEAKDLLNKYAGASITYTFGESKETLDGSTINKWISIDEKLAVTLDEGKVKEYVSKLSNTYNTVGKKRSFTTSSGRTINVGGGDYGWRIDKTKETADLIAAIKEGQTITKESAYTQTALSRSSNDIGKTYVEIDLTRQHLWFYKNGSLVVQGDIVTGNVSAGHTTPPGVYKLKYKQRNAVLRGPDYASPVDYWMPFNGGIGIHDASWRSSFGGKIYKTNGSHGCVNCPNYLAKTVFENISAGTPVVCYN